MQMQYLNNNSHQLTMTLYGILGDRLLNSPLKFAVLLEKERHYKHKDQARIEKRRCR